MSIISAPSFQNIADNIAKSLLDLEAAYQTNPTVNAPLVSTITAGQTGVTNSLTSRVAGLDDIVQVSALATAALNDANNVVGYMNIAATAFYILFRDIMAALDAHTGGLNIYLTANSLMVHSEFANCFNYIANNAPGLGAANATFTPISPNNIFLPVSQTLASLAVTGASSGNFTAGTVIDTTKYGAAPLYIENTANTTSTGTATSFTLTYVDGNGNTVTGSVSLTGALAAGALLAIGVSAVSVSDFEVTANGATGDTFAVIAAPLRTVTY